MNAICLYVTAAKVVLQGDKDSNDQQKYFELNRLLPQLRQLLSCSVCCHLLCDPYLPHTAQCQHNVCRLCVRGRKSLRPQCASCKDCHDFKTYEENKQMRFLLLCYKSLCEHVMATNFFSQLSKQKPSFPQNNSTVYPSIPMPHMSAQEIILEGASYVDILSTFAADIPRTIIPRLPSMAAGSLVAQTIPSTTAATPVPVATTMHIFTQSQIAPKPATTSSSTTSLLRTDHISPPPVTLSNHAFQTPQLASAQSSHNQQQQQWQTPPLTFKHLKNIVDLSVAMQLPSSSSSIAHSSSAVGTTPLSTPTITYVGPSKPGIVVPIVSSSNTTTAPLSIASAKLQTLSRQVTQVRRSGLTSTSSSLSIPSIPPVTTVPVSSNTTASNSTAVITSQHIRNPPPPSIKTVSNGSAMYSVLYTGVGNKITIKRKTDSEDDVAQKKNASASAVPSAVLNQVSKTNTKRRGCRCGNATPTPGKLTCCGQRCPCYVDSKFCNGCKCRGCRNPHRPDGGKVRPIIPELACYEIQLADENSSLSPNELPIATTATMAQQKSSVGVPATATITVSAESNGSSQQLECTEYSSQQQTTTTQLNHSLTPTCSTSSSITNTNPGNLMSFRSMQQFRASQQNPTQLNTVSSRPQQQTTTSNMLQLENLQHESVLIQNAEGNYQFVNVFTTGTQHHQPNTNPISNMSGTFIPHTISMQLQQQLKQNNVITVHPITNRSAVNNTTQQQHQPTQTLPIISSSAATAATTITISPIIVTSPSNTFTASATEGYCESGLNRVSASAQSTHLVTAPPARVQTSAASLSICEDNAGSAHSTTGHLTSAMVEIIDSGDV